MNQQDLQQTTHDTAEVVGLIHRAKGGDQEAFTELFNQYHKRLLEAVEKRVRNHPRIEAEDIVSDAFIFAFRKLDTFNFNAQFYSWLYQIALNRFVSLLRKRRPDLLTDIDPDFANEQADPDARPIEARLVQSEIQNMVRQALEYLTETQREVILLRHFDDYSYAAIADKLKIEEGTVRSRLSRARTRLLPIFKKLFGSD